MPWYKFLGWFLLNVGVSLLAPIALLPLLGTGRQHRGKVKVLLKWALRDGQLFWPVIAMCAAACYESAGIWELAVAARNSDLAALAWGAIGWHVLIIIGSSVLVTISTTDATTAYDREDDDVLSPLVLISIVVSVVTAVSYSAVHYYLADSAP
jgi:hypothetical protein